MKKILALLLISIVNTVTIVESQEICESYTAFSITYESQNCSMYCCGLCNARYCCSDLSNRLDQKLCTFEMPTTRNSTSSYWDHSLSIFYYVFAAISIIFIICFVILIWYKKSKRRELQMTIENNNNEIRLGTQSVNEYYGYNSRYNNNAQSNTRSAFVVADNSAYNYDINNIYNPNIKDELPPSYDTINVQQKNTGDTNETNL